MDSGTTDAQWQSSHPAQGQEDRLDIADLSANAPASHTDYEAAEEDVGEGEGNDERAGLLSGQNATLTAPDHVAEAVDQESGRFCVLRKRNAYLIAASITFAIALITIIVFYIAIGRRKPTHPPWTLPKKLYNNGTHGFRETVIVISLDGFRNDYLDRGIANNITDMGKSS
ncbi:hypothetical protein BZG36_04294 [Bifiguratus adelaidae]|uniref:Uncharacterized protein n=1 Tax=Bifiguratus adelaidae TaxID=1938954 RepID=A0A261XVF8_9FUNG|nr:hypothetical protein BZG36_04294 [Bifiguratus adelaidae]